MNPKNIKLKSIIMLSTTIFVLGFLFFSSPHCVHSSDRGFPLHFYEDAHIVPGNGDKPDDDGGILIVPLIIDLIIIILLSAALINSKMIVQRIKTKLISNTDI